ncbi:MAG: uracil-DNA glycosylase family protein [Rhodoferax sp.]|uniref:uracil-DNA glycosylase family protein n=1 Tax=Rhodoferax sp. TaxID=50421 RepID=UPI0030165F35
MPVADIDLPVATSLLLQQVRSCTLCAPHLPLGVRPVLQVHPAARILVVGQAPGIKVHNSGIPFDDASGERLREWMGIPREVFYEPTQVAIVPMGFCYPGTGTSGDLPPRPECAPRWRQEVLAQMPKIALTLVIGQYAQAWHLPKSNNSSVTLTVQRWEEFAPAVIPLPHPSPRNNIWLKRNPWFAQTLLPQLKGLVASALA